MGAGRVPNPGTRKFLKRNPGPARNPNKRKFCQPLRLLRLWAIFYRQIKKIPGFRPRTRNPEAKTNLARNSKFKIFDPKPKISGQGRKTRKKPGPVPIPGITPNSSSKPDILPRFSTKADNFRFKAELRGGYYSWYWHQTFWFRLPLIRP